MFERHQNEQYFFNESTLEHLADFVQQFENPCCLCVPLLGKMLVDRGVKVPILDIDERFASVSGFRHYDIFRPDWLDDEFDLIICDPPFYKVSLSQLFTAVRKLSHFNFNQPLMIAYLQRRATNVIGTFNKFNLSATGYFPKYQTVQDIERNKIEFFSNLDSHQIQQLREG